MKRFFVLLIILLLSNSFVYAQRVHLTNVNVVDGDTIKGEINGQVEKIRLAKIDCYETSYNRRANFQRQYYNLSYDEIYKKGQQEKQFLQQLVEKNKNNIYLEYTHRDVYHRILGELYVGNNTVSVCDMMLKKNICPAYVPPSRLKKTKICY